jgi:antitoxin (DNA-binding transcriptional repressor) of toxin-antitoxin stability system
MPSTTLQDAQAHLASWIAQLRPGESLVIIEKDRPIARLTAEPEQNLESKPTTSCSTSGEYELGETLAAQISSAMKAGWENPLMDEYDNYDAYRGQP